MKKQLAVVSAIGALLLLSACGKTNTHLKSDGSDFSVTIVEGGYTLAKSDDGSRVADGSGKEIGSFFESDGSLVIDSCEEIGCLRELSSVKPRISKIKTVTVRGAVLRLDDNAFDGFTELRTANIGGKVESIGSKAFSGCSNLTDVTLGDSIKHIGASAFAECTKLSEISLGSGISECDPTLFSGCTGLRIFKTDSDIPAGIFQNNTTLERVVMGDHVENVGANAFAKCTGLKNVTFSRSLAKIGDSTFSGCTALLDVNITTDNSLTIGVNAFSGCTALTKVFISGGNDYSGKIDIGQYVFNGCKDLTGGVVFGEGVSTLGEYLFNNCEGMKILYLPKSLDKYNKYYLNGTKLDHIYFASNSRDWYDIMNRSKDVNTGGSKYTVVAGEFDKTYPAT